MRNHCIPACHIDYHDEKAILNKDQAHLLGQKRCRAQSSPWLTAGNSLIKY
jgi:hypothetical protein